MRMTVDEAARRVRASLGRRVAGFCYVASEAVYHLAGGKRAGLKPCVLTYRQGRRTRDWFGMPSHWFLRDRDGAVVDVTAGQFRPRLSLAEYGQARGCGFLTKRPSAGARAIIEDVMREVKR